MIQKFRELRELVGGHPIVADLAALLCPVFRKSHDELLGSPALLDTDEIESGYPLLIIQRWEICEGDGDPAFTAVFSPCGTFVDDFDDSQEECAEGERQFAALCYYTRPELFAGDILLAIRVCASAKGGEPHLSSLYISVYETSTLLAFLEDKIPMRDLEVRDYGGYTFD